MLQPGEIVDGKYRVAHLIGHGGMGSVFLGENMRIGRRVAIKVLHASVARNKTAVERFEREAQAAARIASARIVDVLDFGDLPTGERFMVMEYLEGESLSAQLHARGKLKPLEAAAVALQVLEGLARIHEAGIIHRDLKPANIFLTKVDGKDAVKILDFGICKFQALSGDESTLGGTVLGTPQYMSPEHAGEAGVDARSDLYSVGVLLYRCVSGEAPYPADSLTKVLLKVVLELPRPLEQVAPGLDPELVHIIEKAMARAPADRYQTAESFHAAISIWVGRVDRLLAEFLGLRHVAGRAPAAPPIEVPEAREAPAPREPTSDAPTAEYPPAPEQPVLEPLGPRAPLPSMEAAGGLLPTLVIDPEAVAPRPRKIGESGLPRLAMDSVAQFEETLVDPVAAPLAKAGTGNDEEGLSETVARPQRPSAPVAPIEADARVPSVLPTLETEEQRITPTGPTAKYVASAEDEAAAARVSKPPPLALALPSRGMLQSLAPDLEPEERKSSGAPSLRLPRALAAVALMGGAMLVGLLVLRRPPKTPSPTPPNVIAVTLASSPAASSSAASSSAAPSSAAPSPAAHSASPSLSASTGAGPSPRAPIGHPRKR